MAAATPVRIRVTASFAHGWIVGVKPGKLLWPCVGKHADCLPVPPLPCRASGAMDNASDYGSEDSRFDSWLARRHVLTVRWEDLYALLWPSVLSLGSTFAADFGGP